MTPVMLAILSRPCSKIFVKLSSYLSPFTAKARVGFTTTMLPPAKLEKANLCSVKTGV